MCVFFLRELRSVVCRYIHVYDLCSSMGENTTFRLYTQYLNLMYLHFLFFLQIRFSYNTYCHNTCTYTFKFTSQRTYEQYYMCNYIVTTI